MEFLYIGISLVLVILFLALSLYRKGRTSTKDQTAELTSLRIELARAEERCTNLQQEKQNMLDLLNAEKERLLAELQAERDNFRDLHEAYENTRGFLKAQQEKIAEQRNEIEELRQSFNKEFELIASKILEEKSHKFTEVNKLNLDSLLSPLKENIKAFEDKVDKVYKTESDERNVLKGEISRLVELNKQISQEAHNLTKALKADTKKQGNWGEVVLDRILEASGLIQGESYSKQSSFNDELGNRLQPDVVVALPDKKHLIIDSKVSLSAYERLVNCEADEERPQHLDDHIRSIRNHIKNLCSKNYCDLYDINSPDFVLLFIPIESSFSIAVQHDIELFEYAWSKRVVIVTPSTLLATLKTISSVWKQEQQSRNALDIANKAGALYDKFVGFITDIRKIGEHLDRARDAHTDALSKLTLGNGNLVGRVENLKKLGARASKQIDQKYLIEEE